MRIVWKDSLAPVKRPIKYRSHYITGHKNGWCIDIPNDNNVYRTHYCAMNAIDAALGGTGIRGKGTEKRQSYGIEIVGKKNESA